MIDNVIVCWENPDSNCGECLKCPRTLVALKVLGQQSKAFPKEISLKTIRRVWVGGEGDLTYCDENIALAAAKGKDQIVKALNKAKLRYQLRSVKNKILNFRGFA